jgi:hypothetical protein
MQAQISRRTLANLTHLRDTCAGSAVSVLDVDAGWLALLRLPAVLDPPGSSDLIDAAWADHLAAHARVLVQPGHLYDLPGAHLAVSLLTRESVLATALRSPASRRRGGVSLRTMISLIGPELEAYVAAHTTRESDLFARLRAETQADLASPQMQVGQVEGALLRLIVGLARPRTILELGTFSGY